MVNHIYLVRHGETQANLDPAWKGEPELTSKGVLQAKALKKYFKQRNLKIYSSSLKRSIQTARQLTNTPIVKSDFNEIYRKLVGGPEKPNTRPNRYEEDSQRAETAWEFITSQNEDIVVVCHGNIIRFFLNKLVPTDFYSEIHPSSVSIIKKAEKKLSIVKVSDTWHLRNEELSQATEYVE